MAFKDTTERNAMNYYISDLHIGHENILRFDNRPFADVNEMNNKLIENWNARVRSDDTVYILGDFIWAKESEWPSIVGSLCGNKVLIRGNHDPKQFSAATKRMFQEITDLKEIKDSGKHVVMCHYPIPFFRASFALEGNQGQRQACCDVSLSDSLLPCQLRFDSVHALRACPSDD